MSNEYFDGYRDGRNDEARVMHESTQGLGDNFQVGIDPRFVQPPVVVPKVSKTEEVSRAVSSVVGVLLLGVFVVLAILYTLKFGFGPSYPECMFCHK